MDYTIAVTCKKCHTKLTKNRHICDCGNVAVSRVRRLPQSIVVYVDDLKTVQFSKIYQPKGRIPVKVEIQLQSKFQWNWSIIEDVSIHKKFLHWIMPVTPLFVFSGAKFLLYFKKWAKEGFKWFSNNKYNSYEDVVQKRGSKNPF